MPDVSELDIRLLLTFDALIEEENVTRAADRLYLTQQAVSLHLSRLRELFGDPLFVRARYGMTPTPRAEALIEPVRAILQRGESLLQAPDFGPALARGTLRISSIDYLHSLILGPFVAMVRKEAPHLKVALLDLEIDGLAYAFSRRSLDIALIAESLAPEDLPSRYLCKDYWVTAVRKDHPIRSKRLSLKQYLAYEHIVVSPGNDASFAGSADHALAAMGKRRNVALSVTDFRTAVDMLRETDMIGTLPKYLMPLFAADMRTYPLPFEIETPPQVLIWPRRLDADPLNAWARDQLVRIAKGVFKK